MSTFGKTSAFSKKRTANSLLANAARQRDKDEDAFDRKIAPTLAEDRYKQAIVISTHNADLQRKALEELVSNQEISTISEYTKLLAEFRRREAQIGTSENVINGVFKLIDKWSDCFESVETSVIESRQRYKDMIADVTPLVSLKMDSIQADVTYKLDRLTQENSQLSAELNALKSAAATSRGASDATEEIMKIIKSHQSVDTKFADEAHDTLKSYNKELQDRNSELMTRHANEIKGQKQLFNRVLAQKSALETKIRDLENDVAAERIATETVTEELDKMRQNCERLCERLTRESARANGAESQLDKLSAFLEETKLELETREEELSQAKLQIERAPKIADRGAVRDERAAFLDRLEGQRVAGATARLEQEKLKLIANLAADAEQKRQLEHEKRKAEEKVTELEATNSSQEATIERLEAELESLEEWSDRAEKEIDDNRKWMDLAQEQIDNEEQASKDVCNLRKLNWEYQKCIRILAGESSTGNDFEHLGISFNQINSQRTATVPWSEFDKLETEVRELKSKLQKSMSREEHDALIRERDQLRHQLEWSVPKTDLINVSLQMKFYRDEYYTFRDRFLPPTTSAPTNSDPMPVISSMGAMSSRYGPLTPFQNSPNFTGFTNSSNLSGRALNFNQQPTQGSRESTINSPTVRDDSPSFRPFAPQPRSAASSSASSGPSLPSRGNSVASVGSRATATTSSAAAPPITYSFLTSGDLATGPRITTVDQLLKDRMTTNITNWNTGMASWHRKTTISHKRCAFTRVTRLSNTKNAPSSENPSTSCKNCQNNRHLCVLVGDNGPVVVPLAPELRAGVLPSSPDYYIRPFDLSNLLASTT